MIDFSLSDEQKMLQEMARRFTRTEIMPVAAQFDESGEFPWDVMKKAFEAGLVNEQIPEEYGGSGLGVLDSCLICEELAAGCAGIATSLMANGLALTPIIIAGTEEQKKKFLTPFTEQLQFASFCLTEPDAGSDAGAVRTTAIKKGSEYVINGTKRFITNGGVASLYVVIALTDPKRQARGLSAFIVPRETPGVRVGKEENKMGQRASNTAEVIFEDAVVPEENRLGREGHGFRIFMNTLDRTRPSVGAVAVGVARAACEYALNYAQERVQFGKTIASYQAIQFKLADLATKIEAARLLVWKAAWLIDRGTGATREASFAKLFGADLAMEATVEAVQIHGGYGYTKEYPVEKLMRDAKLLQIYEGTQEIQRQVIARSLIRRGLNY